jgi:hypothetical protein
VDGDDEGWEDLDEEVHRVWGEALLASRLLFHEELRVMKL